MDAGKSENPLAEQAAPTAAGGDRLTRAEVDQARADVEAGKLSEREYADLVDRFYTSELAQLGARRASGESQALEILMGGSYRVTRRRRP